MSIMYNLPHFQGTVAFADENGADISYHESVIELLDFVSVDMSNFFKIKPSSTISVINIPAMDCPVKIGNSNTIMLCATPGMYWAQFAYQYAHELCHLLIDSPWPSVQDEWFEEVICECASRFWLKRMTISGFHPEYDGFEKYRNDLGSNAVPFSLPDLNNENSIILSTMRNNHQDRDHFDYLANQIMPIIDVDPAFWETIPSLRTVNDEKTFVENLTYITNNTKYPSSFKKIIALFD